MALLGAADFLELDFGGQWAHATSRPGPINLGRGAISITRNGVVGTVRFGLRT